MVFRKNLEQMARIYGGIAIFSVDKGSPTHRAGVRAGDILIAVNGRRVRHMADYSAARRLRGDSLELVVVRGGRTLTLWGSVAGDGEPARSDPGGNAATPESMVKIASVNWRGAA